MSNRTRDVPILFYVKEAEMALIQQKMEQIGIKNLSAYLRKMAIQGYVIKLDLPELKGMVSLLRRASNNLNQMAKRANETGRIYEVDLEEVHSQQERLWQGMNELLIRLGSLK